MLRPRRHSTRVLRPRRHPTRVHRPRRHPTHDARTHGHGGRRWNDGVWTPEPSLGPRVVACDAPGLITPHWFPVRWVPARGLSRPAHAQSGLGVQRTVSGTLTASAATGPPGPKGYGRRPVIGDPIGTVSPVRRRGRRRDACILSAALGPRHPLDGRLVSAYRRSTGQCATWTRGTTRRRGAEARPRPGQTKAPTSGVRLLGNPLNFNGMKSTPVRTPTTTTHDVP